jgi:hypothetical protein|tara:strand:+ start:4957 stop:5427 length:471 start_codon:yes stop_codon:yes gene_type:complete
MSKEVFGKLSEAVVDGVTMRVILPLDAEDASLIDDMHPETILTMKKRNKRSITQNRMYWGLINLVLENQDRFSSSVDLSNYIKLKSGHVDSFMMSDGEIIQFPKSISFGMSDQEGFNKFLDRAIDWIISPKGSWPGMDRDVLLNEVYSIIGIEKFS